MTQPSAKSVIRRGAAWILAGNTGTQVLSFLFGVLLARLLAPEDFGLLLSIQVFTGLAGFIAGGGMGLALVRSKSPTQADYDIVFTLQLGIGIAIYTFFFTAAPWFAHWYNEPLFIDLLRISALSFIYRPLVILSGNILYRQSRYRAQAVISVVTLVTSSTFSVGMALAGHGVWSLVWGGIAGTAVQIIIQFYLTRWKPGISLDIKRGRDLARYGFLVSANDIVHYVRDRTSIFLLSQSLGPASVGLYNKGESLAKMPHSFITGSVYHVLFRTMAAEQDNLDRCRYLFFRSFLLVSVYATPFYIGLLWLGEPLVRGVYGAKWVEAAGPLFVLALAWPFWLFDNLSGAVLGAMNRLGQELKLQIAGLCVTLLAVLIALPYGIVGVAWAIVGAAAFSSVFMYRLALRCLGARAKHGLLALLPAAALNGVLALALLATEVAIPAQLARHDLVHVAISAAIGAMVYVAAFMLLPIPVLASERERWRQRVHATLRSRLAWNR
ncbi:lipopolysaccharide biosynthesis protein [Azohydromonas sediminis]|uniref:lipopolysaccharide biosynthesis protein n=1 Tax=Azohydromonas sediminis TaxID=2259674 RepID=UPI000E646756|nr:lipopolysaccharide biosynthesis protein [Azohydromonas sediminis]